MLAASKRPAAFSPSYAGEAPQGVGDTSLASSRFGKRHGHHKPYLKALTPRSDYSVIPPGDQRELIKNTKAFPFRAIVQIDFAEGDCTGFLIDDDSVVTVGHCVADGRTGEFYEVAFYEVTPGRDANKRPYGSCGVVQSFASNGWVVDGNDEYDYGALNLDCTVGRKTGHLGIFWQKKTLNNVQQTISGYPGDKKPFPRQWKSTGKITVTQTNRVFYENDTYEGQSGAPVYTKKSASCTACVMAIHAYGVQKRRGKPFNENNHATRITDAVYQNLSALIDP